MDINSVTLSGRVFDMRFNPTKDPARVGVAEGVLMVNVGRDKDGDIMDEFPVRAYGKRSVFVSSLKDGTFVVVNGTLREDVRVNAHDPDTVRSKTYLNIANIKTVGLGKEDSDD